MNSKFQIELSSNLDYEGMVVYISYKNEPIACLNYEKGIENAEMEILSDAFKNNKCIISLDGFLTALGLAKKL
jgi:hypothetical protein